MAAWYDDTGWVVAVTGGASTLLTLFCTKLVDALLRIRKAKQDQLMDEKKYEDSQESVAFQQATVAYEKLLKNFEARVNTLELALKEMNEELKDVRKEHVACMVEGERLRGDLKALQVHVDRLWNHDQANKEHVAVLESAIKPVLESAKQGNR